MSDITLPSVLWHCRDFSRPYIKDEVMYAPGTTIAQVLKDRGLIDLDGKTIGLRSRFLVSTSLRAETPDDVFCLQDEWLRELVAGECLVVQAIPAGGGGSRSYALIALALVATFVTAGAAAPLLGAAFAAGTVGAAALGVGISLAGTLLINAVLPIPKPKTNTGSNSPNYGLTAGSNTAAIGAVIPVQYGRFKSFPNYAAQPYTENRSNITYLYQLFCIGQGQYDIESILVGDSLISTFPEIQYEIVQPGGQVTLFPDNVVTSDAVANVELILPADQTGTPVPYSGPYVTNPPGTKATRIDIDVSYPAGIFRTTALGNTKSIGLVWVAQYQAIDDSGNPIGNWINFGGEGGAIYYENPYQFTQSIGVPPGRYQVRAGKTFVGTGDSPSTKVYLAGMRAYLPSQSIYGDVTMLAVIMKATNTVNSTTQHQINVLATRKLPIWNGSTWSAPIATRSIAWAFADVFRNVTYGRAFADEKLPLEALLTLDTVWTQRGDYFDGIFDDKSTTWEAAKAIARVGRALPLYYAGVIDIIRDAPKTTYSLMLTPNNIINGSLSIDYLFPNVDTADYVIAKYIDPVTWKETSVDCAFSDSQKLNGKTVDFTLGIIDHDHAFKEGMYMMACSRDQRRVITLQTELAGMVPQYGDLIGLSHDVPAWGQSGVVLSIDPASGIVVLSDPVRFSLNQQHFLAIQAKNGSAQGPYHVVDASNNNIGYYALHLDQLTSDSIAQIQFSDGSTSVPTAYAFGPASNQFLDCVLLKGKPTADGKVNLTLTNYSNTVFLAETDQTIPIPTSPSGLVDNDISGGVSGIGKVETPGGGETGYTYLSVDPIPGAVAYEFEISYDDGVTWLYLGISPTNVIKVVIQPGSWIIRARAYGKNGMPGAWASAPIIINGKPWPLGIVTSFTASQDSIFSIDLSWAYPTGLAALDAGSIELRYSPTNVFASSAILATLAYPTTKYTMTTDQQGNTLLAGVQYYFWCRLLTKTSGDPGAYVGPISGQTSTDATAILAYLGSAIGRLQLTQDLLTKIDSVDGVITDLDAVQDQLTQIDGDINQINGFIANFGVPQFAGDTHTYAGDTVRRIGIYSQAYAREQGDFIVGGRIDVLVAQVTSNAAASLAAVTLEQQVRANADTAIASNVATIQAQVSDPSTGLPAVNANVQTNANAVANLGGLVNATYNIKVQIDPGTGKYIAAGMAIGVTNASGIAQSQIIFQADLFSLINIANGVITTPFSIVSGQTFIASAVIQDGSIVNAKIGSVIQSTTVGADGQPLWKLDKNAGLVQRSASSGARMELTATALSSYDSSGTLRAKFGNL